MIFSFSRFQFFASGACAAAMAALRCAAAAEEAPEPAKFETEILPLVQTYCISCHHEGDLKGDLDLARFERMDQVENSIAIWQRMAKRIESKEMPPRRAARKPTDEERQKLVKWIASLKESNVDCNKIQTEENQAWYEGTVRSRRMTRAEYENTIRDLLGARIPVAQLFPADGAGGVGFDTSGSALFLSAIQMEKYLEAAELTLGKILPEKRPGRMARLMLSVRRALRLAPPPTAEEIMMAAARERLVGPGPGLNRKPKQAAEEALARFLPRAWRRPVKPDEIEPLMTLFRRAFERGDSYDASMKLAMKGALLSPNFIFISEPEPDFGGIYPLDDFTLAARVSYFLWSSMPDDELFLLAKEGKLSQDDVLREQVRRMLRDPKARALGENFATQWLGVSQLGVSSRPDAERFPEFDDALADSMRGEAIEFFHHIVAQDKSVLELLSAEYSLINEPLAKIYGIAGVSGQEFRPVQLADANRGGVLGMAAVLTATSQPLRTSPVLRGKWVLEQVLGDHIPPPPPNAGTLPADDKQTDGLTLRQRLEAHRVNPDCAGCHQRMDPIGFGLENFDPIGRWRADAGGAPLDTAGVLPSGEKFNGPAELKQIVLARKGEFVRNLSRKMYGYAMGRELNRYDECVIDACAKALAENEYKSGQLFEQIVLSYPFRHRYSNKKKG